MARIIRAGLIQAHNVESADAPIEQIKKANIDNQMKFVEEAAKQGVQMLCFQEIFTTPYFCAEQQTRWYEAVEKIPDGPTVKLMQDVAKQHGMSQPVLDAIVELVDARLDANRKKATITRH